MSKKKRNLLISLFTFLTIVIVSAAATTTGLFTKKDSNSSTQNQEGTTTVNQVQPTDTQNEAMAQNTENISKSTSTEPTIVKYTVKPGDTLDSIAKAYNVKISTISESNGISDKDYLKEGQQLEFPSIVGVLYSIKSGENLWDLASTYDINMNDIVGVNNLESPDKVKIGQKIILPNVEKIKVPKVVVAKNSMKSSNASKTATKTLTSTSSLGAIMPTRGRITSKYGPRWGSKHTGLDIGAPMGSNVYASMSGKVSFSGWKGSYGNLVIIDHGNGLQTYYAHNSKLLVKSGQSVDKGTVIAKVGSTGNSTGPHSHFEVRKNGVSINPLNYLK